MNKEILEGLTPTEMRFKIANKQKAVGELSVTLSKLLNDPVESKSISDDIRELNLEISQMERHLGEATVSKPFNRSLNETSEL